MAEDDVIEALRLRNRDLARENRWLRDALRADRDEQPPTVAHDPIMALTGFLSALNEVCEPETCWRVVQRMFGLEEKLYKFRMRPQGDCGKADTVGG